jgi:hypothetical protein
MLSLNCRIKVSRNCSDMFQWLTFLGFTLYAGFLRILLFSFAQQPSFLIPQHCSSRSPTKGLFFLLSHLSLRSLLFIRLPVRVHRQNFKSQKLYSQMKQKRLRSCDLWFCRLKRSDPAYKRGLLCEA